MPDITGERKLIQAIIDKAIEDATPPRTEYHNPQNAQAIQREARRWLSHFAPAAYANLLKRQGAPAQAVRHRNRRVRPLKTKAPGATSWKGPMLELGR